MGTRSTYFLAQRCTLDRFWLRPSTDLNRSLEYILALAADKYAVGIHAVCFSSYRWAAVFSAEPDQAQPFEAMVHRLTGKLLQVLRRFAAEMGPWPSEPPQVTQLNDKAQILEHIATTLAIPVDALFVANGDEWPGVRLGPGSKPAGEKPSPPPHEAIALPALYSLDTARPRIFGQVATMPKKIPLAIFAAPGWPDPETFIREANEHTLAAEAAIRERVAGEGRRFVGRAGVLRHDPSDTPGAQIRRWGRK